MLNPLNRSLKSIYNKKFNFCSLHRTMGKVNKAQQDHQQKYTYQLYMHRTEQMQDTQHNFEDKVNIEYELSSSQCHTEHIQRVRSNLHSSAHRVNKLKIQSRRMPDHRSHMMYYLYRLCSWQQSKARRYNLKNNSQQHIQYNYFKTHMYNNYCHRTYNHFD